MHLKFNTDDGLDTLEIGQRITVHPINEWRQIFQIGRCNWYCFTLAYFYAEYAQMTKQYEVTCILLGLGFTLTYDKDFAHSEVLRRADEAWEEIKNGETMGADAFFGEAGKEER
jgi:hypothetical protein